MTPKQISVAAFFTFFILILLQLAGVFDLFLIPILWAVILAIVFYPTYRLFLRLSRGRRNLAASLVVFVVILITVGPMVLFAGSLVGEVLDFTGRMVDWIKSGRYEESLRSILQSPVGGLWQEIKLKTEALNIKIVPITVKFLEGFANSIVGYVQTGAKNFAVFVLDYLVTIFALFFFVRDGEAMATGIRDLLPLSVEHRDVVFGRIEQTLSAVVRGVGLTGVTQGILAGLAFWILGVPYPLFFGLLIAFLAFLPIGGAAAIWIPASINLYVEGHWIKALILFIYGTLIISMVDNLLKPLLIGEQTKLPTLFLFFSILGGLAFYGFIGVFLGPVLLALFLTLIEIYRKEYAT